MPRARPIARVQLLGREGRSCASVNRSETFAVVPRSSIVSVSASKSSSRRSKNDALPLALTSNRPRVVLITAESSSRASWRRRAAATSPAALPHASTATRTRWFALWRTLTFSRVLSTSSSSACVMATTFNASPRCPGQSLPCSITIIAVVAVVMGARVHVVGQRRACSQEGRMRRSCRGVALCHVGSLCCGFAASRMARVAPSARGAKASAARSQ